MATRTRAFLDHQLPGSLLLKPLALVALLTPAIPACQAVHEFWVTTDPSTERDDASSWKILEQDANGQGFLGFGGRGGIGIEFGSRIVEISTAARWRGFLTIPPLREVHHTAFTAIAHTVGATRIVLTPSYVVDSMAELLDDGVSLDELIGVLEQDWGSAQRTLDEISDEVMVACEHCPPRIWYLDRL